MEEKDLENKTGGRVCGVKSHEVNGVAYIAYFVLLYVKKQAAFFIFSLPACSSLKWYMKGEEW